MAIREINLVPGDILDRRHMKRHLSFWTGCLMVSLLLVFGFHLYQRFSLMGEKGPILNLQDIKRNLSGKQGAIKEMQNELGKLNEKYSALSLILKNPAYSDVLLKLIQIMNGQTWLKQVSLKTDKADRVQGLMEGFSFRNEDLGDFIAQLSSDPFFESVLLKYARETMGVVSLKDGVEQGKLIEFQITTMIHRRQVR